MGRPKKQRTEDAPPEQKAIESLPPDPPAPAHETISKAEAVRRALAAGKDSPAEGVPYIKEQFGIDIPNQMFSSYKGQQKARDAKQAGSAAPKGKPGRKPGGASPTQKVDGYLAPLPKSRTPGDQPDLLAALEAMKPLVASLGKEQAHRIVDLLG